VRDCLARHYPDVNIVGAGQIVEIFKDTGLPADVVRRFDLTHAEGTHAIGHTRMATESAVTTAGSHPFSTGDDLCLVHNGSLSNHNRLRELLEREGFSFHTENDTEVAAAYFTWRLRLGETLDEALTSAIRDLDGFYTFCIGTANGFAVLRDPIACKHAVLAETDDWVAMATEFRAIAHLPGADTAKIWEPAPQTIYSWEGAAR
jgi:glutamate synthase domain-containing protein 1